MQEINFHGALEKRLAWLPGQADVGRPFADP